MVIMKIILLNFATVSAVSMLGLAGARAADPLPPVPPGGSVAPPSSSAATPSTPSSQQVPLSPNPGGQGEHGKQLEKLKQELGLTPEQVKRMRPVLKAAHEQAKTVRENAALNEQQKHQQVHQIFAAAFHQLKPMLTPAQIARLKQLRAERRGAPANT